MPPANLPASTALLPAIGAEHEQPFRVTVRPGDKRTKSSR
jgi:hypothetical protein